MINLSFIAQVAYDTLEKEKKDITPKSFASEFCKTIKEYDLKHEDCEHFEKLLEILENEDDENFSQEKIHNMYDLADQLFKKHSQDRTIILRNTTDISKLLVIINDHLMSSISGNKEGVNNIAKIRNEIEKIHLDEHISENIIYLKDKLVDAAGNIETHVNNVTDKLETSTHELDHLKNKIQELEKELSVVKKEKKLDHLTQVLTRGSYEAEIKKLENEYLKGGQDYAIIFMDLDHFKNINDTYGHEGGDFILQTFAQIVKRLTRSGNVIGRYGGEEFIVALKYFEREELIKYISRIKEVFSSRKIIFHEHKIAVTFSAGVELRSNMNNYQETLSSADKQLYKAKGSGRNKIILPFGEAI